jgi:F-type H+-transporting ATPase subunit epsilon
MSIELVVVTPEGEAFSGPVEQVVLPGAEGEFGVLEAHERFLSALNHGCLEIRTLETRHFSAVSNGFAEVGSEKLVVLVDSLIPQEEIDVEAARATRESASAALEQIGNGDDPRKPELEDSLARANAQLDVASRD